MQNIKAEQTRLKLEESLKDSLNRDIDFLAFCFKIRILRETVLCIRKML